QQENIFNVVRKDDQTIACYGYCFDVREPKTTTLATLDDLLEKNNIEEDIKYLNGHYILIHNISGEWRLTTNVVSIKPSYLYSQNNKALPSSEQVNAKTSNSSSALNLNYFTISRMDKPTN